MIKEQKNKSVATLYDILSGILSSSRKVVSTSLLVLLAGIFLLPQTAYSSALNAENIIEQTNQQRSLLHLEPLSDNRLLAKAAYKKAQDIFDSQKFQHNINGKKFSGWIREAGYDYSYAGENLAIDFAAAESVIDAWKLSPLHYKNIINPHYAEIGVAVVEGRFEGQNTILVVQIFGSPRPTASAAPAVNSSQAAISSNHSTEALAFYNHQFEHAIRSENLMTNALYGYNQNRSAEGMPQLNAPDLKQPMLKYEQASFMRLNTIFIRWAEYKIFASLYAALVLAAMIGSLTERSFRILRN